MTEGNHQHTCPITRLGDEDRRYYATSECLNDVCISPPCSPCFYLNRQPVQSVIARLRSICKISGLSHLAWIDSKACLSVSIWILMARMLRLTLDWMICCCRLSVTVNTTYKGIRNLIDHMPWSVAVVDASVVADGKRFIH